ncbi:Transposon Ty3-I Gag-Pol polyprotein [Labeo rohita]|uniref:Transposon Ty3-I Gag-Pol polyprotein n=1 Tax=Labeo rohita TaxID=84645 RepID=A0ABQ8LYJ9_LABRO|nr:Transposon Ty3-I Gag-Pol polyprotein [Labeo rohita]
MTGGLRAWADPAFAVPPATSFLESPEPEVSPEILAEYMAFQNVFSKQAATRLPPHRPWDCAIELLPGAQLPKGRIYPLSIPECQAMEEHIVEALQQRFIQPSTSPATSSFFFVGKKDGGLRPCIDYPALEELHAACVFSILDLRSAYNLIRAGDQWKTAFIIPTGQYRSLNVFHSLYLKLEKCEFHQPSVQFLGYVINAEGVQMDQGKVQAIQEWPTPNTVKELQHFLGFSNFYWRFIQKTV